MTSISIHRFAPPNFDPAWRHPHVGAGRPARRRDHTAGDAGYGM